MNVNFNGYGENIATFICDSTVTAGTIVKMSDSFTVTACVDNDDFVGICVNERDGYAAIQLAGYVEVDVDGNVELGCHGLVSNGCAVIMNDAAGKKYNIINNKNGYVGFIL